MKEAFAHIPSLERYNETDNKKRDFKKLLTEIWDKNNEDMDWSYLW